MVKHTCTNGECLFSFLITKLLKIHTFSQNNPLKKLVLIEPEVIQNLASLLISFLVRKSGRRSSSVRMMLTFP